ncbi:MAG: hypothetical protein COB15_12095 [Flavobacteriales bacterium]|nr:MAG: hypothetical protein COB15_12095 [Flavobacteriales bacterium]
MDQETARAFTTDPLLQQLLMLEMLVLPEDCPEGIKDETRRSHLYTLKDLLDQVVKKGKGQDRIDQALINALNTMAADREWAAPTLGSKAADLYGCLQRLDQYTNLKPIELLKVGSFWKDASKHWLKMICGHTPTIGEVTPEAVAKILMEEKLSLPTAVLLTLCWCTTGRPFNWLYVKRKELTIVEETEEMMKADAERRGTALLEPGYKITVTWTDHKTLGTRQAFTTHSWVNKVNGEKIVRWKKNLKSDWMFPKVMWDDLKAQLAKALREHDAEWGMKALRRGSLSTMARNETPLDDLRLFSGHPNEGTLLRYLGWGVHAKANAVKGEAAARGLDKATRALLPTVDQAELEKVMGEVEDMAEEMEDELAPQQE